MSRRTILLSCFLFGVGCSPRTAVVPDPATALATERVAVEVGQGAERIIGGGEEHVYEFAARGGDYIRAFVEQQGLDVILSIHDSEGERIHAVSSRERRFGPELAYVITEDTGVHEARVRPADSEAPTGTYAFVLEAVRPATDAEREQMEREAPWYPQANEMFRLASRGDWDEALDIYAGWLDIARTFPPRDNRHRDVAVATISLSRALWNRNVDRDLAESMLVDGVEYQARIQGPDGYLTATMQRGLADIYLGRGRREEAWPLLENALRIMESADDAETSSLAATLVSIGNYHRQMNALPEAIEFVKRGLAIFQDEEDANLGVLLTQDQIVPQTQFQLGNLYRLAGDLERARPLIEAGITPGALRFGSPLTTVDRFSKASMLWLELGDYARLQEVTRRALEIADRFPTDDDLVRGILTRSAEGYLLSGDYEAAETAYRRAIEVERARPVEEQQPNVVAPMLNYIAGILVDQGHYRDANGVYREAFEEELARPWGNTFGIGQISENWAAMLRDLGMDGVAETIVAWPNGDRVSPPPYPGDGDIPALVEPDGLTRHQILRRTRLPYRRDLSLLWRDLGAQEWSVGLSCQQCQLSFISETEVEIVARIWTLPDEAVHYLLLVPAADPAGGAARLNAVGVLDLPMGEQRTLVQRSGTKAWLQVEAGTGREWPYDFITQWYAITPSGFEPASPYPDIFPDQAAALGSFVSELHQPSWPARRAALETRVAIPGALESGELLGEFVGLLARETQSIDASMREGTGAFSRNGEGYREYVRKIAQLLMAAGDLSDPPTLEAIATSYYIADSSFSRELADRGGPLLTPIAIELVESDIPQKRWNGLSLLARLYERRDANNLTTGIAADMKRVIVDAVYHDEVSTRQLAVEILGRIGAPDDLPLLRDIADSDLTERPFVRETALKAIEAIQSRNP